MKRAIGIGLAAFVLSAEVAGATERNEGQGMQSMSHGYQGGGTAAEIQRLQSEVQALEKRVAALEQALHRTGSTANIPPGLVQGASQFGASNGNNSGAMSAAGSGGAGAMSAAGNNGAMQSAAMVHRKKHPH
jgi:hypothetical protein